MDQQMERYAFYREATVLAWRRWRDDFSPSTPQSALALNFSTLASNSSGTCTYFGQRCHVFAGVSAK